jgi:hypothetical protein
LGLAKKTPTQPPAVSKVHRTFVLKRPRRGAKVKEDVWRTDDGEVVKYSLAYINFLVCGKDNGRVLGYDNSHDYHHRHFMGTVEPVEFDNYETLAERFWLEVQELWKEGK